MSLMTSYEKRIKRVLYSTLYRGPWNNMSSPFFYQMYDYFNELILLNAFSGEFPPEEKDEE